MFPVEIVQETRKCYAGDMKKPDPVITAIGEEEFEVEEIINHRKEDMAVKQKLSI